MIFTVTDSFGNIHKFDADTAEYFPQGGEFDANTLVVLFYKGKNDIATFTKPIAILTDKETADGQG